MSNLKDIESEIDRLTRQKRKRTNSVREAEIELCYVEREVANARKKRKRTKKRLRELKRYREELKVVARKIRRTNVLQPNYWQINPVNVEEQPSFNDIVTAARANYSTEVEHGKVSRTQKTNVTSLEEINAAVERFTSQTKEAYKIQIYIGVIASRVTMPEVNLEDESASYVIEPYIWKNHVRNHTYVFSGEDGVNQPLFVHDDATQNAMMERLTTENFHNAAERIKDQSGLVIRGIYSVLVKMFDTTSPWGAQVILPDKIINNRYINTVAKVKHNMCFWASLAIHKGARHNQYMRQARRLFKDFYPDKRYQDYEGVHEKEFDAIEEKFGIAINVYEQQADDSLFVTRRSISQSKNKLNLLTYENHLMRITNLNKTCQNYRCHECNTVFVQSNNLLRHFQTCSQIAQEVFPRNSKYYKPPENIVIQAAKLLNVYSEGMDFMYDFHAAFDYEAMLKAIESAGKKIIRTHNHEPASVSVYTNVPGFTVQCFVIDDEKNINKSLVACLLEASSVAGKLMTEKLQCLFGMSFERLLDALNDFKEFNNKALESWISQLPCFVFNGGKYDINLNKKHGLMNALIADTIQFTAKKAHKYMAIATKNLKFLDASNYLPAGTSYEKYLKAYDTELGKGFWPYEWFDGIEKLKETQLPPISTFYSTLRSCNTLATVDDPSGDKSYEYLQGVWRDQGMHSMRDMLIWYNNLDVIPFIEALTKQKEFYKSQELDMSKDAISVPGLAEKIMFMHARDVSGKELEVLESRPIPDVLLTSRIKSYKSVDLARTVEQHNTCAEKLKEAREKLRDVQITDEDKKTQKHVKREVKGEVLRLRGVFAQLRADDVDNYLTDETAASIVHEAGSRCVYCGYDLRQNNFANLSYDRILNAGLHTADNVVACCILCNKTRGDRYTHDEFMRMSEMKRIEYLNGPQIRLISDRNKAVFVMLSNVTGGPSLIFHRHHKAGETKMRRPVYDESKESSDPHPASMGEAGSMNDVVAETHPASIDLAWNVEDGKIVETIVGYDANALYLWALGQEMPCGELERTTTEKPLRLIEDVKDGDFFGFVEVDIETPKHLWNKFAEFPPIFLNTEVEENSAYMRDLRSLLDKAMPKSNRKLISTFSAKKIVLYTPLLQFYLKEGLIVTKVHSLIKAKPNKCFAGFADWVSDARRDGDADPAKAVIAEAVKLTGNSAFGITGMDKKKHQNVIYATDLKKAKKKISSWLFRDLNEIEQSGDGKTVFEIRSGKKVINQNKPCQVAAAVYQLAKLRMLQFYYHCLAKYIDSSDFQLVEMDTDSMYMGLSAESFEVLIKSEMRAEWEEEKLDWFPDNSTPERAAYTRRTPGLFKQEWKGDEMVCLTKKSYYCHGTKDKNKMAAKGIQGRNNADILTLEKYKEALYGRKIIQVTNRGFRVHDNEMTSYTQRKDGLCPIYDARMLFADGVTTRPVC
jgi:hypothetical protein